MRFPGLMAQKVSETRMQLATKPGIHSRPSGVVIHVALNPVANPAVNPGRRDLPTRFETSTGFAVFFAV